MRADVCARTRVFVCECTYDSVRARVCVWRMRERERELAHRKGQVM